MIKSTAPGSEGGAAKSPARSCHRRPTQSPGRTPEIQNLLKLVDPSPRAPDAIRRVVTLCAANDGAAKALRFAARALDGRKRGAAGESALLHAVRVADVVAFKFEAPKPELVSAALLHDVLEDSDTD